MIAAVVPAAGFSRRMGRCKLTMPYSDRTVIEHVVATLREGGVERIVVVLGPHNSQIASLVESARGDVCMPDTPTIHMRETVERGLDWLEERFQLLDDDAWLLAPADRPGFNAAVIRSLIAARSTEPARSIVAPTFNGRLGHPVLFAWRHVAGIHGTSPGHGIDEYLRLHNDMVLTIPQPDARTHFDLDTPEDYHELSIGALGCISSREIS